MIWFTNNKVLLLVVLLAIFSTYGVNSDRILVVAFFSSISHKLTYMPLIEELGKRGHNITILSPIKATKKLKNIHEVLTIDIEERENETLDDKTKKVVDDPYDDKENNKNVNPYLMLEWFEDVCRQTHDLPQVQAILKEKFDLVFVQPICNECSLGLAYRMKAPLVLFSPISATGFVVEKVGGYFPLSVTPHMLMEYYGEMNFYQRFLNFGYNVVFEAILKFYYEPAITSIYREKLGSDIPPVNEILAEASLVLSNGHFSLHLPKPHLPNVIDVGGIHSVPAKSIPDDLENFIQQGKDGFILFSMGSALKGSQMPDAKRKLFLNVFSKLKQQVLWKWETETMPDLPKNVKLSKWLPQQDLLGHKDIKMFITHCGGGSTEEAIYHGVPIVGFPIYGDQPLNAKLAKNHNIIVEFDWNTMNEEQLLAGIQDVLHNPKYSENVKKLSKLYRDQPDPLDKAVYWVEYVLRHGGAEFLKYKGRNMNFVVYHSYDVIVAYICVFYLTFHFIFSLIKLSFKAVSLVRWKSSKQKNE